MEKLVSIITPNYNTEKYIEKTIQSVLLQTYLNWEMIIVDDCSTDNSILKIEKYLEDPRIILIKQEVNKGPVAARNLAIQYAKGNIIAFLDSDDIWMPNKLETQVQVYLNNEDTAIVFSNYEQIDPDGNVLKQIISLHKYVYYKDLLKTSHIGCLTATYNVDLLGKRYFVSHGHEDYILWLSILKEGYRAVNVQEVLAQYRISSNSISANKRKAVIWQWNIYRNIEKIGLFRSIYYFTHYAIAGLKKHKR